MSNSAVVGARDDVDEDECGSSGDDVVRVRIGCLLVLRPHTHLSPGQHANADQRSYSWNNTHPKRHADADPDSTVRNRPHRRIRRGAHHRG